MGLKKTAVITLMLGAILFFASDRASSTVVFSKHDFTVQSAGNSLNPSMFAGTFEGDNNEVCVYCHSPHLPFGSVTPLWNKPRPATPLDQTFWVYSSATMYTKPTNAPSVTSLLCLSCHDGVSAINAVRNSPGAGNSGITPTSINRIGDIFGPDYRLNIGNLTILTPTDPINLRNDHPISINYEEAYNGRPGRFKTLQNGFPNGDVKVRLFSDKMECSSCHNPHNGIPYGEYPGIQFMARNNASSSLCFACHIK